MAKFLVAHREMDRPFEYVDLDPIALLDQGDHAAFRRLRRDMADREPRRAARKTPIRDQGAGLAEPFRFQIARRIEHFLHTRTAARPLIADEDNIARNDLSAQNRIDRALLALEDARRPGEGQNAFVDPRRLHDAAILRQIAVENGKTAILGKSMGGIADD